MKIYIIDDEPIGIFIIQEKIKKEGIAKQKDIHTFQTAKEAIKSLKGCSDDELPNVVLLDLSMPEMDGWQFLEATAPFSKRLKERCRVYILTSSLSILDEEKAKQNPLVAGFIQKPINTEDIQGLVPKGNS